MTRVKRLLLPVCLGTAALVLYAQNQRDGRDAPAFTVVEASISEMQTAMERRDVTSRDLVNQYLVRIALYEDKLHASMTVNPHAIEEAAMRDQERARGMIRGPLHGIPLGIKDIYDVFDWPTAAGSRLWAQSIARRDATSTMSPSAIPSR